MHVDASLTYAVIWTHAEFVNNIQARIRFVSFLDRRILRLNLEHTDKFKIDVHIFNSTLKIKTQ